MVKVYQIVAYFEIRLLLLRLNKKLTNNIRIIKKYHVKKCNILDRRKNHIPNDINNAFFTVDLLFNKIKNIDPKIVININLISKVVGAIKKTIYKNIIMSIIKHIGTK